MKILFHLIVVLEMVFVNLYTFNLCSKQKRKPAVIWTSFALMTAVLVGGMIWLLSPLKNYGNGNGLFVLVGFLYIIPINLLYDQPLKYSLTVMCSAWIYTMTAFTLAVRVGYLFPDQYLTLAATIFQTIFYIVSLWAFLRFVKDKFVYIVKNVQDKTADRLLRLCLSWFISIILLNYVMVADASAILKLLVVLLLSWNVLTCYHLFYSLVSTNKRAQRLKEENRLDPLTGLRNRISFYEDAQSLIEKYTPFCLVFFDLDNFKQINDSYGHAVGDQYLVAFSEVVCKALSREGVLYRISGDEFIFLAPQKNTDVLSRMIAEIEISPKDISVSFLGFSFGCSSYPQDETDLNRLISLADYNMYTLKKEHKRIYPAD